MLKCSERVAADTLVPYTWSDPKEMGGCGVVFTVECLCALDGTSRSLADMPHERTARSSRLSGNRSPRPFSIEPQLIVLAGIDQAVVESRDCLDAPLCGHPRGHLCAAACHSGQA